jgi:hypothetical protein
MKTFLAMQLLLFVPQGTMFCGSERMRRALPKLHFWVVNELRRLKRPEVDSTVVFQELRQLICDQLGIAPDRVIPEVRFVQDLHVD